MIRPNNSFGEGEITLIVKTQNSRPYFTTQTTTHDESLGESS